MHVTNGEDTTHPDRVGVRTYLLQPALLLLKVCPVTLELVLALDHERPCKRIRQRLVLLLHLLLALGGLDDTLVVVGLGLCRRQVLLVALDVGAHLDNELRDVVIVLGQLLERRATQEQAVQLALVRRREERLCHVLREQREGRVHVNRKVGGNVVELALLGVEHGPVPLSPKFPSVTALVVERTLNDNLVGVLFAVVRELSAVPERDDDCGLAGDRQHLAYWF